MADPSSVPAWIPIISAASGGLVVGIFGIINNCINKKAEEKKLASEERRHFKELLLNSAVDHWKHAVTVTFDEGRGRSVAPLDAYLIHMVKLSSLLSSDDLTKDNIASKLEEIHSTCDEVEKFIKSKETPKQSK